MLLPSAESRTPLELAQLIAGAPPSSIVRDPSTGLYVIPTVPATVVTLAEFEKAQKVLALRRPR